MITRILSKNNRQNIIIGLTGFIGTSIIATFSKETSISFMIIATSAMYLFILMILLSIKNSKKE